MNENIKYEIFNNVIMGEVSEIIIKEKNLQDEFILYKLKVLANLKNMKTKNE